MIGIRKSQETAGNGNIKIEVIYPTIEKLPQEVQDKVLKFESLPAKPNTPGYNTILTIDDNDNLEWYEQLVDTPEFLELVNLVSAGNLTAADISDQEVRIRVEEKIGT